MKEFLFKISFYIIGIAAVLLFLGSYADGNTDDNYMHFAVKKPHNIILGDSRGAQGIVPEVLKTKLSVPFDNFSLNIGDSPYGQVYLKALKRKLDPDTKDGIFIVTVSPWNLSLNELIPNEEDFPEKRSPLNNMYFYDWTYNYEYLLKNYTRSWFKIYMERESAVGRSNTFLHKDGWMEVNVNMHKDSIAARTAKKTREYEVQERKNYYLSPQRLAALNEIIGFLRTRGRVCLVRIPTSKNLTDIENRKFPQFKKIIQDISHKQNVKYYDFSEDFYKYVYTDGNHMYKESGKKLTSRIADSLKSFRKN
ncbi:hypothetical protein [Chryseobacterium sp. Tr-659]|uniref:hypothetical protein n=1 Tax=Chryseobacterium sp. Tr-659 TaxID=2608340 RepID=UPI001E5F365D|nr:hypothetical protein [Chryseobacterium sp. Tr-659]